MRIDFTKMHGLGNDFIVFDLPTGASLPTRTPPITTVVVFLRLISAMKLLVYQPAVTVVTRYPGSLP